MQPKISPHTSGLASLKRRLWFVLLGLFVFRLGAHIPVPGVDLSKLADLFRQHHSGILGLFNMFSGGALSRLTLFALGVMPYISASIIMQLLTVAVPGLEQLKKEGESGRRKLGQYTRYSTLVLALFQAVGISKWLMSQGMVLMPGSVFYLTATVTLATGTLVLMWLGEQMTERGIGNGISLIIFAGIVSRLPSAVGQLVEQVRQGQMQILSFVALALVVAAITAFVVFVERGQRRITVNYAKRQQGRQAYAGQPSHLPLKINMAGVIPPIFASSIILFPATLAQWFGHVPGMGWLNTLSYALSPGHLVYIVSFSVAILFFCFFYTALVFNPSETADNLKRSGAFLPGIRPGEQTAKFIDQVMTKLTVVGALYLIFVALMPQILIVTWHVPFYFGGTSLLIVVVVVMDFIAQIQAHLMSEQYAAMMRKSGRKSGSMRLVR